MGLGEEVRTFVEACYSGLWVVTAEAEEAEREIRHAGGDPGWLVHRWDQGQGVRLRHNRPGGGVQMQSAAEAARHLAAESQKAGPDDGPYTLWLLHNWHFGLRDAAVLQHTANACFAGKATRNTVVVLSPHAAVPPELRVYFQVLHHRPPGREDLTKVVRETLQTGDDYQVPAAVLDALAGLSRHEAENALAYGLVTRPGGQGPLSAKTLWGLKADALNKGGTLQLYRGEEKFDSLAGYTEVKDFALKLLSYRGGKATPKGLLLDGAWGCGKSAFAVRLGNEVGRPTLRLSIGNVLNKHVGESEAALARDLHIAEEMAPCVLFIDELQRELSGADSNLDSGVMSRLVSKLLSWRQDTRADVFLLATTNGLDRTPGPLLRAGRNNGVFFFDLPSRQEKDAIWALYLQKYGRGGGDEVLPADEGWTGAEVEGCVETAELLGCTLKEAAKRVVPMSVRRAAELESLREQAEGRCLSASCPGVYRRDEMAAPRPKRRGLKPGGGGASPLVN